MSIEKITGIVDSIDTIKKNITVKLSGSEAIRQKPVPYSNQLTPSRGNRAIILKSGDSYIAIGFLD